MIRSHVDTSGNFYILDNIWSVGENVVNLIKRLEVRASPSPCPSFFKECVHNSHAVAGCKVYKVLTSFISLTDAEFAYASFRVLRLANLCIQVSHKKADSAVELHTT